VRQYDQNAGEDNEKHFLDKPEKKDLGEEGCYSFYLETSRTQNDGLAQDEEMLLQLSDP